MGGKGCRRFHSSPSHSYLLRYKQKHARPHPLSLFGSRTHRYRHRVSSINVECTERVGNDEEKEDEKEKEEKEEDEDGCRNDGEAGVAGESCWLYR